MISKRAREGEIPDRVGESDLREVGAGRDARALGGNLRSALTTLRGIFRLLDRRGFLFFWKVRPSRRVLEQHFHIRPKPASFQINCSARIGVHTNGLITLELHAFLGASTETIRIFLTAHKDAPAPELELHLVSTERAGEFSRRVAERG